jgi:LuxR family maltose regulon positive regulatory protein
VPADVKAHGGELQSLIRVRIAQHRASGEPDLMPILALLDRHIDAAAATSSAWHVEVLTLKALLLHTQGRAAEAMPPLNSALATAKPTGRVLVFLEHGSPMVELLQEAACRSVETGYVGQILAAFEAGGRMEKPQARQRPTLEGMRPAQAALIEPLSDRELQVLRLLNTPLSQPEIADRLYISVNTVRSHVKHIYAKLGVHGRTEATVRAEELGLL